MPPAAISFQVGWYSLILWFVGWFALSVFKHFESTRFVKFGSFKPRIIDWNRFPAYFHAYLKLVLLMCGLPDCYPKYAGIVIASSFNAYNIPQVNMMPLIKRTR